MGNSPKKMEEKVQIVPIKPEYEKDAYAIWQYGMSTDLTRLFMEYYFYNRKGWCSIVVYLSMAYQFDYLIVGFLMVSLYWFVLGFGCWKESCDYIKSRVDLFDGKNYHIYKHHGDKFLVALVDDKVVGTISYAKRDDGKIVFGGVKRPPCLEIFSLSVSKNVRGLGIGRKLCDHIEMLARKENRNLYLETSMAQLPAIALYRKLGYRDEPKPHSFIINLRVFYKALH